MDWGSKQGGTDYVVTRGNEKGALTTEGLQRASSPEISQVFSFGTGDRFKKKGTTGEVIDAANICSMFLPLDGAKGKAKAARALPKMCHRIPRPRSRVLDSGNKAERNGVFWKATSDRVDSTRCRGWRAQGSYPFRAFVR